MTFIATTRARNERSHGRAACAPWFGPLPPETQFYTVFAAERADSTAPDAARGPIKFLRGLKAIPVIKLQGMELA